MPRLQSARPSRTSCATPSSCSRLPGRGPACRARRGLRGFASRLAAPTAPRPTACATRSCCSRAWSRTPTPCTAVCAPRAPRSRASAATSLPPRHARRHRAWPGPLPGRRRRCWERCRRRRARARAARAQRPVVKSHTERYVDTGPRARPPLPPSRAHARTHTHPRHYKNLRRRRPARSGRCPFGSEARAEQRPVAIDTRRERPALDAASVSSSFIIVHASRTPPPPFAGTRHSAAAAIPRVQMPGVMAPFSPRQRTRRYTRAAPPLEAGGTRKLKMDIS